MDREGVIVYHTPRPICANTVGDPRHWLSTKNYRQVHQLAQAI